MLCLLSVLLFKVPMNQNVFAHFGSSLCANSEEKLDGKKQKSVFLPLKIPKIVSPKTGNELAQEAGRMTSQIAQNVCLFGRCQVFEG